MAGYRISWVRLLGITWGQPNPEGSVDVGATVMPNFLIPITAKVDQLHPLSKPDYSSCWSKMTALNRAREESFPASTQIHAQDARPCRQLSKSMCENIQDRDIHPSTGSGCTGQITFVMSLPNHERRFLTHPLFEHLGMRGTGLYDILAYGVVPT